MELGEALRDKPRRSPGENPEYTKRHNIVSEIIHFYRGHPVARKRIQQFESPRYRDDRSQLINELFPHAYASKQLEDNERILLFRDLESGIQSYPQLFNNRIRNKASIENKMALAAGAHTVLINGNLGLIIKAMRNYSYPPEIQADLAQHGAIGLDKAVRRFDQSMELSFSTYALPWVNQELGRHLTMHRAIRIPHQAEARLTKMRSVLPELEQSLGRPPSIDELYSALKKVVASSDKRFSRNSVVDMVSNQQPLTQRISLNEPLDEQAEDSIDLIGVLPDHNSPDPVEVLQPESAALSLDQELLIKEVAEKAGLQPSESRIFSFLSGVALSQLEGKEIPTVSGPRPYDELINRVPPGGLQEGALAEMLGITQDRINKAKISAISKLRAVVVAESLVYPETIPDSDAA